MFITLPKHPLGLLGRLEFGVRLAFEMTAGKFNRYVISAFLYLNRGSEPELLGSVPIP